MSGENSRKLQRRNLVFNAQEATVVLFFVCFLDVSLGKLALWPRELTASGRDVPGHHRDMETASDVTKKHNKTRSKHASEKKTLNACVAVDRYCLAEKTEKPFFY